MEILPLLYQKSLAQFCGGICCIIAPIIGLVRSEIADRLHAEEWCRRVSYIPASDVDAVGLHLDSEQLPPILKHIEDRLLGVDYRSPRPQWADVKVKNCLRLCGPPLP